MLAVLGAPTLGLRLDHPTGHHSPPRSPGDDPSVHSRDRTETHDSSGPGIAHLGPRQTAGLDLDSGRWTRLASPPTPAEQTDRWARSMPTCSPPHRVLAAPPSDPGSSSLAGNGLVVRRRAPTGGPRSTHRRSSCRRRLIPGRGAGQRGDSGRHPGRHRPGRPSPTASGGRRTIPHLRATT